MLVVLNHACSVITA